MGTNGNYHPAVQLPAVAQQDTGCPHSADVHATLFAMNIVEMQGVRWCRTVTRFRVEEVPDKSVAFPVMRPISTWSGRYVKLSRSICRHRCCRRKTKKPRRGAGVQSWQTDPAYYHASPAKQVASAKDIAA
jgi:hypothetical protein